MLSKLSRRAFLSGTCASSFGLIPGLALAQDRISPSPPTNQRVWVANEWEPLRAVIVGRADDARFPLTPVATMEEVLDEPRSDPEVPLELERRLVDQLDGLAALLETQGITVFRPNPLSSTEKQYLDYLQAGGGLIFMRDPLLVVGSQVVELALRPVYRQKEIFSLRPLLTQLHSNGLAGYFAMPRPAPKSENLFLEGGDVLLAGRDVLVGISGQASDLEGAQWLQKNLGPAYKVHTVRLKPEILHLDLAIALLRPGLAIIDPGALVDGVPPLLQGWDLIVLEASEAEALAANVLVIDPQTVVVEESQSGLIGELVARGIKPLPLPFDAPIMMEGAFRCATHPLLRVG